MALRGEEWSVSCEGIGEQQGDGRTGARKDDGNEVIVGPSESCQRRGRTCQPMPEDGLNAILMEEDKVLTINVLLLANGGSSRQESYEIEGSLHDNGIKILWNFFDHQASDGKLSITFAGDTPLVTIYLSIPPPGPGAKNFYARPLRAALHGRHSKQKRETRYTIHNGQLPGGHLVPGAKLGGSGASNSWCLVVLAQHFHQELSE
ncbi:hypothetical protein GE21DRAFT_1349096 [Neurospora crassa]|nr:hypothetical protein B7J19.110 [imported] - Neurospora crassa [Neurospora crassa]KHE85232.1 hypothetical protein GE21DRAFT_1349096 [Neurospora crassa]